MSDVPAIFSPVVLRSGVKFRRLRDHNFSMSDVVWLCDEIERKHAVWEYQIMSTRAISRRYDISHDGVKYWLSQHKDGSLDIFSGTQRCVPSLLDGVSERRLKAVMQQNDASATIILDAIEEEVDATSRRRIRKEMKVKRVAS